MLERSIPLLKTLCLVLAALVILQLARVAARKNPLAGVSVPAVSSAAAATNAPALPATPGTNAVPKSSPDQSPAPLPPLMQACTDRIAGSEIFGPVPRPPSVTVALLGIAGRDAFVRAPDGKTGLVREGAEFGGLKLLRIGTNRVLIEQSGRTQELSIFSGFGSKPLVPLVPTEKEKPQ